MSGLHVSAKQLRSRRLSVVHEYRQSAPSLQVAASVI